MNEVEKSLNSLLDFVSRIERLKSSIETTNWANSSRFYEIEQKKELVRVQKQFAIEKKKFLDNLISMPSILCL